MKIPYNEQYSYEIFDDGYDIYEYEKLIITQRSPYDKVFIPNGTYEENALYQIEDLIKPAPIKPSEGDILRSDMDYIALMMDIDLPSYDEEEGE